MKNLPDSAIKTLLIAYHLYKEVGADRQAASLCCSLADVYRQKKDYQKAKEYILQYERDSGFFDENGNIVKIRTDRQRYDENQNDEKAKYDENDNISLEQIYDHIKIYSGSHL